VIRTLTVGGLLVLHSFRHRFHKEHGERNSGSVNAAYEMGFIQSASREFGKRSGLPIRSLQAVGTGLFQRLVVAWFEIVSGLICP
jgi:hypothetical protein